jgi:hypothetical protein
MFAHLAVDVLRVKSPEQSVGWHVACSMQHSIEFDTHAAPAHDTPTFELSTDQSAAEQLLAAQIAFSMQHSSEFDSHVTPAQYFVSGPTNNQPVVQLLVSH